MSQHTLNVVERDPMVGGHTEKRVSTDEAFFEVQKLMGLAEEEYSRVVGSGWNASFVVKSTRCGGAMCASRLSL